MSVVITGIGLISSLGISEEQVVKSILNDKVNFLRSEIDPELVVCPVQDFDFKDYIKSYKYFRYLPKGWQFGICAAKGAIESSGLTEEHLNSSGLFVGVGPNVEAINDKIIDKALGLVSVLPNTITFCISHLFGIHGENLTIQNACASSLQAIGEGFLRINQGLIKVALCGGSDSRLGEMGLKLYKNARVLLTSDKNIEPHKRYAPFDKKNQGFVPGEGGAFLVLEEMEHAKKRGAKILGEVIGYSSSLDGLNPTAPDKKGVWAKRCVKSALEFYDVSDGDIDVIFSHGTGTPLNDLMEINLIKQVFPKSPFVCSLKSWIGHLAAACGAAEVTIGLFCLKNRVVPKVRNLKDPRDKGINFVFKNINKKLDVALFESFGFGGQNAALIVKIMR